MVLLGPAVFALAGAGALGGGGSAAGPSGNVPVWVLSLRGPIFGPPWTPIAALTLGELRRRMASVVAGGCDHRCWPDADAPERPSLLVSGPFLDDGCTSIDSVDGELVPAPSHGPAGGPDARLVLTTASSDCVSDVVDRSSLAQAPQVLVAVPLDALPPGGTLTVQVVGAGNGSVYAEASITIPDGASQAGQQRGSAPRTPAH